MIKEQKSFKELKEQKAEAKANALQENKEGFSIR